MVDAPCVIVISGLPGSGKSVTAKAVAARLGPAAHVEADALQRMIVAGLALPDGVGPPDPGSAPARQLRLRLDLACGLARHFVEAGFTAVVDDIVIGGRLAEVRSELDGLDVRFVMLDPPFDHVRARWVAMKSPFADRWDWIEQERRRTDRVGLWLDTSEMTVDEVADAVIARLDDARLISN